MITIRDGAERCLSCSAEMREVEPETTAAPKARRYVCPVCGARYTILPNTDNAGSGRIIVVQPREPAA